MTSFCRAFPAILLALTLAPMQVAGALTSMPANSGVDDMGQPAASVGTLTSSYEVGDLIAITDAMLARVEAAEYSPAEVNSVHDDCDDIREEFRFGAGEYKAGGAIYIVGMMLRGVTRTSGRVALRVVQRSRRAYTTAMGMALMQSGLNRMSRSFAEGIEEGCWEGLGG